MPDNGLPASEKQIVGAYGAHISWANTANRPERTAAARKAFNSRFEREAEERWGKLPPAELARRADSLRKAYFLKLAHASAKARRLRREPA